MIIYGQLLRIHWWLAKPHQQFRIYIYIIGIYLQFKSQLLTLCVWFAILLDANKNNNRLWDDEQLKWSVAYTENVQPEKCTIVNCQCQIFGCKMLIVNHLPCVVICRRILSHFFKLKVGWCLCVCVCIFYGLLHLLCSWARIILVHAKSWRRFTYSCDVSLTIECLLIFIHVIHDFVS